ncbi:uncharacterized protein LOC143917638 isoform X1 [Arctopsyche grandis]|uniref:uncharacterized protein LOC143917638 isoform X1 n=1 Tax=Arctopsyche grandis TaxID=121162 RepID=UPI00406D8AA4
MTAIESVNPLPNGSSSKCCCCLGTSSPRSLVQPYLDDGEVEVYSEMIHKCFGLQIVSPLKDLYVICDFCVTRVRNATSFRSQIEIALETIKKHTINRTLDNAVVCERDNDKYFSDDDNHSGINSSDNYSTNFEIEGKFSKTTEKINEIETHKERSTNLKNYRIKTQNKKTRKRIKKDVSNLKLPNDATEVIIERRQAIGLQPFELQTIEKNDITSKISEAIDKSNLTCKVCNETFPWYNSLKRHMSVHFPNHTCNVCGKSFLTLCRLQCHVRNHLDTKESVCNICNKTYASAARLKMHLRIHSDVKLNKCPQCPERFKTFHKKVKHLISVHNDEPNKYKCKLCPKRFVISGQLKSHVRRLHAKERNHKCQECSSCFYNLTSLKMHMLMHTGVKNFTCDVCKKSYGRSWTLKEHMKIHNNVKTYVCHICSKAFTQKCTLKGHMKIHGKDNLSENGSNEVNENI